MISNEELTEVTGIPLGKAVNRSLKRGHCEIHGEVWMSPDGEGKYHCLFTHEGRGHNTNLERHFRENRPRGKRSGKEGH